MEDKLKTAQEVYGVDEAKIRMKVDQMNVYAKTEIDLNEGDKDVALKHFKDLPNQFTKDEMAFVIFQNQTAFRDLQTRLDYIKFREGCVSDFAVKLMARELKNTKEVSEEKAEELAIKEFEKIIKKIDMAWEKK